VRRGESRGKHRAGDHDFRQISREGQGFRETPLVTEILVTEKSSVFLMIWFCNNTTKRELKLILQNHLSGWKSHGIIFSFCSSKVTEILTENPK